MSNNTTDEIHVDEFLRLTNSKFGSYGIYHISEAGVTARLGDLDDLSDLSTEEAATLLQFKREAKLSFPTTRRQLLEWVKNTNGDFTLPDDFEAPSIRPERSFKQNHDNPKRWEYTARAIGEKWMLEQRRLREKKDWPGQIEIAKYVEGELSNREIIGPHGRFLDWGTIKRHALTGLTGRKPTGKK